RGLAKVPGVRAARVNLTLRRVAVTLATAADAPAARAALEDLGYDATVLDPAAAEGSADPELTHLVRAVGVAGFAAGNVMLLSVSVWSGAEGATRDLFHLISAMIAIPAALYAGQSFYRSAFSALCRGRLNMDVPISIAVLLALGMSLFAALSGGEDAYFDAAVMLLFFLLIGRTLDRRMRARARSAVTALSRLAAPGATVVAAEGTRFLPLDAVEPGMRVRVLPGGRVPADGRVVAGASDLDRALITGESAPVPTASGMLVEAGTLNLTGPLDVEVTASPATSYLAEVERMMTAAEAGRGAYVRVADRMAQLYAPIVHLLALITGLGWWAATGNWHLALTTAIAVLIVTCPCALGLAVPVVHVVGAARLFEAGILLKDGAGLERLARIDRVVFDKSGTLTVGIRAAPVGTLTAPEAAVAVALAQQSTHPAAVAVAAHLDTVAPAEVTEILEEPGAGIAGLWRGQPVRLGRPDWAGAAPGPGLALRLGAKAPRHFALSEDVRPGAETALAALSGDGLDVEILSGDDPLPVGALARTLGVEGRARQRPEDKIARIRALQAAGQRVLMVGDGLNDAPALRAADVSMAPASAADVGRAAADLVFLRPSLDAVPGAIRLARRAGRIVRQNFGLALAYNAIAVPLAMAGHVTPLVAALAMSASSILVIANSLRLRDRRGPTAVPKPTLPQPKVQTA
ncbi:MAG: heavy metal translocating P-type ATPase, partial [Pseudomonadota bacterium]